MNELITSMSKLADFATNGVVKGVELILKQAPEIASQFLKFKLFETGFTSLLLVVVAIIIGIIGYTISKRLISYVSEYSDVQWLAKLVGTGVAVTSLIGISYIVTNAYTYFIQFMYIELAPKVYLIEFFSKLVKQ